MEKSEDGRRRGSFFRSSSLELEDFSVSSSPLKSRDRKIGGGEGEMDLTFKSLGFSGPEDLHISFDAWEAWSTRELDKHKVLSEAGPGGVNITDPDITELMMRSDSSLNKTDLIDRIKQDIVVRLLNLRSVDANEKYEVLRKLFKLPGVSSVIVDDSGNIIVTGTVDIITVRKELKQHRPLLVLSRPMKSDESDEEGASEKLDGVLLSSMDEAYTDETLSNFWTGTPSASSKSWDSDSGNDMTIVASKITTTILKNDWDSFREFLSNRLPLLTISSCSAKDVIDFLRMQQTFGMEAVEALVGYLKDMCEAHGIRPMDNPFRSLAVTSYLNSATEMTREKECILVFSCNENYDVDETSFIEAISKELHKREVTPLMYNLLSRENLHEKMLRRSSVGIMILSHSYACSRQALDHLVEIIEHGKATNLVIIPIYFKASLSDICGLEGRFEPIYLQYMDSAQLSRVQKWKAAMAEIASIDGHEWKKE